MTHLIAIAAEPYTMAEIAEFEHLILASNNPDHATRLLARAVLATFFRTHGKAKCDLMMVRLTRAHDDEAAQAE